MLPAHSRLWAGTQFGLCLDFAKSGTLLLATATARLSLFDPQYSARKKWLFALVRTHLWAHKQLTDNGKRKVSGTLSNFSVQQVKNLSVQSINEF